MILQSDTLEVPTLENLWNYLSHFYAKIPPDRQEQFAFEDLAGIYTEGGRARLFALCTRHGEIDGLQILPKGKYLCASCTEQEREQTLEELLVAAQAEYGVTPAFAVQLIMVSGILQWDYEVQVWVEGKRP